MVPILHSTTRNMLIRTLDDSVLTPISRYLERVQLAEGEMLMRADAIVDAIWFPETAVVSLIDVLPDGSRVELGIVGFEGMVGWSALLGNDRSPHDGVVRVGGGTALRIDASRLLSTCEDNPCATGLFLKYVNAAMVQIGRTAVSNLRDKVEQRLSRWLLMCHDRLEGDEIDCTHKVIAGMLGIRRASVTDGLHNLEGESVIRNRRGRIVIRDRGKLMKLAGDGYGHSEAVYSRTIAPFGK